MKQVIIWMYIFTEMPYFLFLILYSTVQFDSFLNNNGNVDTQEWKSINP